MTLAAEIRELDDDARVRPLARLVLRPGSEPAVIALAPEGGPLASSMLEPQLVGPDGRTVRPSDGADYLRVLRWARSSERLWITTLAELPDDVAFDPTTPFPDVGEPTVPATVPYPDSPAGLVGVQIVEICRPRRDDLLKLEVVARVVRLGGDELTTQVLEPEIAGEVGDRVSALESEGEDPLVGLVAERIRPDLAGRWVRYDRPFDRASRDAVVTLHRTAVAAGDTATRNRLEVEYRTRLPRLWLSRCPFTQAVLRLAVDAYGFDGPWFDPVRPVRPVDDELPSTFLALTGEAPPGAGSPDVGSRHADGSWKAGRPWILPDALSLPAVRAVLSTIRVGKREVWLVAYFADQPTPEFPLVQEWGTALTRVLVPGGVSRLIPGAPQGDRDFVLDPWIESGKLSWIEPLDQGVTLREGLAGLPYGLATGE